MKERKITYVSGLYYYSRNGKSSFPHKIISEIEESVKLTPWYKSNIICYADSKETAKILDNHGLYVHNIFDNAPNQILINKAHKMKHWIMYNAVKEFNDVVWIDWDTYLLKPIDQHFENKCLKSIHPKFTYIHNYWATVNCSVYYLNQSYLELMEKSFHSILSEPNDELLWKSVLPENIRSLKQYWLDDYVINVWEEEDFKKITKNTYFLHLRNFELLKSL
ncbi:MAG: hypothetical protein ABIK31_06110 [candidate division WOR-3 bacterium]